MTQWQRLYQEKQAQRNMHDLHQSDITALASSQSDITVVADHQACRRSRRVSSRVEMYSSETAWPSPQSTSPFLHHDPVKIATIATQLQIKNCS